MSKHIGLEETVSAKDKRQHLLDVWFGRIDAETKFCVETTIEAEDEWLHAFTTSMMKFHLKRILRTQWLTI